MKKFVTCLSISLLFLLLSVNGSNAQSVNYDYEITNFVSDITLNKDTSLNINETITVNFPDERHGIYRNVPVTYSANGRTIQAKFDVMSVKDETGKNYKYTVSRFGQSMQIKIGDPDIYVKGENTYVINYKIKKIIQRFDDHDELFWNVTGSQWDTDIINASASVDSPFAKITDLECFSGAFGGSDKFCNKTNNEVNATFSSTTTLGTKRDFTIVVAFDPDNRLEYPSGLQDFWDNFLDNWGYVPSIVPLLVIFAFWYKKGRDRRFLDPNIYYEPKDKSETDVGLFERSHIPLVYHPIQGLSPSEIGTIVDEKVNIGDVIGEIVELARLGFLEIRKIVKKKLIGSQTEFAFIKTGKTDNEQEVDTLKEYQQYLLKEVFRSTAVHRSVKKAEDFFKGDDKELDQARRLLANKEYVLLSGLKNHFYEGLPVLKEKLYKRMEEQSYFSGNPETVRGKWIGFIVLMEIGVAFLLFKFADATGNYGPLILQAAFALPAFGFSLAMPRRTAKGYALYSQIKGLKWYLEKGKWRHDIAEKHLFIEEILPLAIVLGVVSKLAKDMAELGVTPPKYFTGSTAGAFQSDFATFQTTSSNSFLSAPGGKWSGSSSWSGGSGFSGGSSGGGFGGGGGGSW